MIFMILTGLSDKGSCTKGSMTTIPVSTFFKLIDLCLLENKVFARLTRYCSHVIVANILTLNVQNDRGHDVYAWLAMRYKNTTIYG